MNRKTKLLCLVWGTRISIRLLLAFFLFCVPLCAFAQRFQVGANALDLACLGTLNAEFDVAVDRHWTVGVSGKYNPFLYGDYPRRFALKQRSATVSARWWPWYVYSGWWVSGSARWQEYNMGGIMSPRTEEGNRYGGGVTAGYSHMVSQHFNVEFGLGIWGGVKRYTVYACPTCGEKLESGVKTFVLPSDAVVSLYYVF